MQTSFGVKKNLRKRNLRHRRLEGFFKIPAEPSGSTTLANAPRRRVVPRLVCWQGPPDFESGLATKVRFLPGEPLVTAQMPGRRRQAPCSRPPDPGVTGAISGSGSRAGGWLGPCQGGVNYQCWQSDPQRAVRPCGGPLPRTRPRADPGRPLAPAPASGSTHPQRRAIQQRHRRCPERLRRLPTIHRCPERSTTVARHGRRARCPNRRAGSHTNLGRWPAWIGW